MNSRSARIAALAITLTAAHPAIASPIRLSHQGRLLDETGAPLEGEHELTARLVTEAGDLLWSDSVPTVFQHGYYHLVLGAHAPLDDELFRGGTLGFELAVDGGPPIAVEGPLTHVPYAAVAEWAREAHSVHGGVVDASVVRVNGQTVLQAGATTTLGRVRADHGLQLGAAATAACEAGTRGLLRYTSAGALEVCSLGGWVEVGASEPGTCSIVGECPGGEEPSRVWFTRLELYSERAIELFCSRYDSAIGFVSVNGPFFQSDEVLVPCLGSEILSLTSNTLVPPTTLRVEQVERVVHAIEASSTVQMPELRYVGANLFLRKIGLDTSLPALQVVRGDASWTWDAGVAGPDTLENVLPALETVGGSLLSPISGPRVSMPNLLSVGGALGATTIAAPMVETIGGALIAPATSATIPLPSLTTIGGDYDAPSVDAPNLREIGGTLRLSKSQPPLPSLEVVGALTAGGQLAGAISRIDTPFPLSGLASLRAVQGPLTIHCVRGWSQTDLESFVDRIGRDNIVGPISLVGTESARCVG